jgi:hypothetical protein
LGKNQMKGSDARLYAVKLAMFIIIKHDEGNISESILELSNALIDIIGMETMLWKRLPKYFFMVIFFGDPNTVLVMTPNLKHALNNLIRQYLLVLPFLLYICSVY